MRKIVKKERVIVISQKGGNPKHKFRYASKHEPKKVKNDVKECKVPQIFETACKGSA